MPGIASLVLSKIANFKDYNIECCNNIGIMSYLKKPSKTRLENMSSRILFLFSLLIISYDVNAQVTAGSLNTGSRVTLQESIFQKYLGNYLLTKNIQKTRLAMNLVGTAVTLPYGLMVWVVPTNFSMVEGFNTDAYDCAPSNPNILAVVYAALAKNSTQIGASPDKLSFQKQVKKFMTTEQIAQANNLPESCTTIESQNCKIDITDDLRFVSIKSQLNKVDSSWGMTYCKANGDLKYRVLQNRKEKSFVLQRIKKNTIVREFSAKESEALDLKFRTDGTVKEKIIYRPIQADIQANLKFNQQLTLEKDYSYKYDKNGNLTIKYGFEPIRPKLTYSRGNNFMTRAEEERMQGVNLHERYYKTGELKEKTYFSKTGQPFLVKTFKKNGKVKRERRM